MRMLYRRYSVDMSILIFLFFTVLSLLPSETVADVVKIKNGGEIEGIIQQESDGEVIVEIKFGKITLAEDDIESITKASKEKNDLLKQKWEREKQRTKKSREYTDKKTAETKQKRVKPKTSTAITRQMRSSKETQTIKQKPKTYPERPLLIRCNDNIHSYAAYLPVDYEKRRKYPVLFCFDPGGDGATAVRKFVYAAKEHGWIVVGSLDAKNGPWEPILSAQSAMLKDVKKRYNVDQNRYYAAGFSGGARMSYTIAYDNPSNFKGVIACSAGFCQACNYNISRRIAVYHCVGETDYAALSEIKKAHAKLKKKGVASHLNIFPGGHSYPPNNVIREAVDWIASR